MATEATVRKQKLKKDQLKRVERFEKCLDLAKQAQNEQRSRWEADEKIYDGTDSIPADIADLLTSNLTVKWAWQQIQTIIPRVMDPDPRLDFRPVETGDNQLADNLRVLVRQQLFADNFVMRQYNWIEDAMVRRLGVGQVIWYQRHQEMRTRVSLDSDLYKEAEEEGKVEEIGEDGYAVIWRKMIVENRPSIRWQPLEDFFPDPAATSDQDWKYVFQRVWLTKSELEAREAKGIYSDVKLVDGPAEDDAKARGNENSAEAEARRQGKYAVFIKWSDDGTRMSMCNGILLEDRRNPYYHGQIPFVAFNTQPNPRSLFGHSEVEPLGELQKATWIRDNQRIDAVAAALNLIVIADPNIPGLRGPKARVKFGKVIHAMQGQRLEQWQLSANAGIAFQETENYLGAMQQMTGASPLWQGNPAMAGAASLGGTATEANIWQEEGNKRMAIKKLQFRLFVARCAKMMAQLSHQYLSEFELQRILGLEEYAGKMTPEQIPMFLDVMPEAMSESLGLAAERNSLIELLNITGELHGTQMLDGTYFDIKNQIEAVIKSYSRDPRHSFRNAEDVMSMAPPGSPSPSEPTQPQPDIYSQAANQPAIPDPVR